jgi:hypothetical protein
MLQTFLARQWNEPFPEAIQHQAIDSLENGQILYFPTLAFSMSEEEKQFLTPDYADPDAKNIGYHSAHHKLWGVRGLTDQQHTQLKAMLDRFSRSAFNLVQSLLPPYASQVTIARTSFRPVQVSNRKTSYRKDDRRLHVDAFPSAPNQGKRILRVFCNVNPSGEDRVWRVGEPFETVANQFIPHIPQPIPGLAAALRFLKITKSYRTSYDHYMLRIHNRMKADEIYQQRADQQEIRFAPGSAWIAQTDHVSHAAMKGQHVLEQTFYLPIQAMVDESRSPLKILEKILNKNLV